MESRLTPESKPAAYDPHAQAIQKDAETFGSSAFESISIPLTEEDWEADMGRSRATSALAAPLFTDLAADVDEDQELRTWISDTNSAVRQPFINGRDPDGPVG